MVGRPPGPGVFPGFFICHHGQSGLLVGELAGFGSELAPSEGIGMYVCCVAVQGEWEAGWILDWAWFFHEVLS